MKAGVASEQGLVLRDIMQPRAKANEVLVKVRAASLNRADLTTARALPHGSHGGVGAAVGLEWAGEVVEAGAEIQGGYQPGDTWDLYVGKDHRVVQMVYHRGGPKKPSLVVVTWAAHKKAGPLLIATEHRGTADGKPLHIFMSDVSVKLAGSDSWIKAE